MDSAAFYDDYVDRQMAVGVNQRHREITRWLGEAGLRPTDRILEIGCGIGTLTGLLAEQVAAGGEVVAVDLSPRSIDVARRRLSGCPHVTLRAGDALELELPGKFGVVVLPDVIEHIPLELHPALFHRVREWLEPNGFALLHYPNPHYLQWCREHRPEVLQLVDQPIHADRLLADACPAGLYLDFLKTYSIWIHEGDYVVAVLRPLAQAATFTVIPEKPPSLAQRALRRAASRLR